MHAPIPLICDRCRAEGAAGEDAFARYADLLDFEPVPRRPRADGWDAEVQRAFIAALAATGSARQAAHAVGKAQFGAEQLKKAKGNESFMAAWARAEAYFAENRSLRLAEGLRAVTAAAQCRAPRPAWGHAATRAPLASAPLIEAEESDEAKREWLIDLTRRYLIKVRQEREARLRGKIVAADFYVRQLTFIEVMLDVKGGCGFKLLDDFRKGDHHVIQIAETPFSRYLGQARRDMWAELGEPPRSPAPPPPGRA